MSKTTTKRVKKTPTRTSKRKSVKSVSSVKKTAVKKSSVRATRKKTSSKVSRKQNTSSMEVDKASCTKPLCILKRLFSTQKNIIFMVAILLVLGVGYLAKDMFVVAMINGKPIYRWTVVKRLEEQGGKQVLDSLVTETLVRQAVKSANVDVDQTEIDLAVKEIEDRISSQGITLDQALEEQGMTRDQLIDDIILQKSAEKVVSEKVVITDDEISQYIEENAEFFPEDADPESFRETVRQQLYSAKLNEEIQVWVQDLQDNSKVIYLKEYSSEL
ncbi:MAG: hypothetical protein HN981_04635 [Candidatus Pacebacteria bacterium]|jgi:hypothetical protein|nr:hypothetical protein [Candidatus Paceibacterota bacterium]MBT4652533.1 hypothetical protein [Candidatus Paceibacterota bacterium]MBT6756360.1 hypothetical protein [Candidatus Paceibacterota bacterium]MBT6921651.1 hypothetical protein [Candidatus Paceibacterota bacterium]